MKSVTVSNKSVVVFVCLWIEREVLPERCVVDESIRSEPHSIETDAPCVTCGMVSLTKCSLADED